MKALKEIQEQAKELRKQGLSVKQIAKILNKPRSSISLWVRTVKLTEEQKKYLDSRNPIFNKKAHLIGTQAHKEIRAKQREEYQLEGKNLARYHIEKKEIDFIAGLMLYWAEGYRSNNKNTVGFSNTDLSMIKFFTNFLVKYFNINLNDIRISIYCHKIEGLSIIDIQNYWINNLGLNVTNLNKSYVEEKRKISGKKKNIFPYGVCTLRLNKTEVIQKIYGAIQEYIGCEFPVCHQGA